MDFNVILRAEYDVIYMLYYLTVYFGLYCLFRDVMHALFLNNIKTYVRVPFFCAR